MNNNIDLSNDDLEEQGLVECCLHCGSLHIVVEVEEEKFCRDCGTVNYTEVITEDEYNERMKIKV